MTATGTITGVASAYAAGFKSCVYAGAVMHHRVQPRRHKFTYRVFSCCFDVDEIDDIDHRLRTFSRNRWNILSFHDVDFGAGDGSSVGQHVRQNLERAGYSDFGHSIRLLCYPRMFGYVFNPLSVYFCADAAGRLGVMIYEVSNTFGERQSYVMPLADAASREAATERHTTIAQACAKGLYVSPFTSATGDYRFRVIAPHDIVLVAVRLSSADGPVLDTCFRGSQFELSDAGIVNLVLRYPLMTLKVIASIHYQAARLWLKGVPIVKRHLSPRFAVSVIKPHAKGVSHDQQ